MGQLLTQLWSLCAEPWGKLGGPLGVCVCVSHTKFPLFMGGSHLDLTHMMLAAALAVLVCLLWLSQCRWQLIFNHHVFGPPTLTAVGSGLVALLDWVLQLMHLLALVPKVAFSGLAWCIFSPCCC